MIIEYDQEIIKKYRRKINFNRDNRKLPKGERKPEAKITAEERLHWNAFFRQYRRKNKKTLEHSLKWKRENREKQNANHKKYAQNNRLKINARSVHQYYINKGDIIRPDICTQCGRKRKYIHGHHYDYSKPLEVIWLCHNCHVNLHAAERKIKEFFKK